MPKKVDPQAIVDGLRSGNAFVVTGDLIDFLDFSVNGKTMGQTANPGSEKRIPRSAPFMPVLTTNQVANYIVDMIEKNKRILIKPGIFRTLFWSYRHWPDQVAERMNKTV